MDSIFIIASQVFKADDKLPKYIQERVPNNEMTWQRPSETPRNFKA